MFGKMITSALNMQSISKTRRAPRDLPSHLHNDVGFSHERAVFEASRPMWDIPSNR